MEGFLSFVSFTFLAVVLATAAVGSTATSQEEAYWQKVMPNTPMPSSLRDAFILGRKGVRAYTDARIVYGPSSPAYTDARIVYGPSSPAYTDEQDQIRNKFSSFFLEKDLDIGSKMNLIFSKPVTKSTLHHGKVSGPPLDKNKLPEILREFSVQPNSEEAKAIEKAIQTCNKPANKGEYKFCATSLQSITDFAISKLGSHVAALETTVDKETSYQEYTVAPGVQKMKGKKSVVCHQLNFVYPVYYCHETAPTSAYVVPLVGKDGLKVNAAAVCHKDTSSWSPKHLAFQLLKVKPGSVPVCHFIAQGNVVWVQN